MTDFLSAKPSPQQQQQPEKSGTKGQLVAGIASGIGLLLILLLVLDSLHVLSLSSLVATMKPDLSSNQSSSQKMIAKVGSEVIYQSDLDTEIASYPPDPNVDKKAVLLKKLITDSIILQGAAKEGLIKLDPTVFNTPNKNYPQRIAMVNNAKKAVEQRADILSGDIISIWFFNMKPGAVGYEKGKEIALSKITQLQKDVVSKKLTMQQAAQQIKNDASLAQVDTAYKGNAILHFEAENNERITFSPDLDTAIRKLTVGQVSDVITVKDKDRATGEMIDAEYVFVQLTEKKGAANAVSFSQWLAQQETKYEIITY